MSGAGVFKARPWGLKRIEIETILAGGIYIIGATATTYTPTQAEVGKVIAVHVSYADGGSTAESVTSSATANVVGLQAITIGNIDSDATRTLFGDQSLVFVSSEIRKYYCCDVIRRLGNTSSGP